MTTKLDLFKQTQMKKDTPDIRPGDIVRVSLKLAEKTKRGAERTQVFEGLVIAKKHGKGMDATFTVRKISEGVGVERIFPIHCPAIIKIELVKHSKVRRAKLYYMRERKGKKARMKSTEPTTIPTDKQAGEEKSSEIKSAE
jgi:large subunit ribosomal protein L19